MVCVKITAVVHKMSLRAVTFNLTLPVVIGP